MKKLMLLLAFFFCFAGCKEIGIENHERDANNLSEVGISILHQGSFTVGGTVKTSPGTYDPLAHGSFNPANQSTVGQTLHGDHATVFYQIPDKARNLPLVFWHGYGQSATIRKAHAVQPVAALQSEYSLIQRALENEVIDTCGELGIGFVPWGPVCRGFLGDKFNEYSRFSENSRFASVSYFTPEAIETHMEVLILVREWARKKNATTAQISLAWLLAQKPFIVPIPGTTKLHHVKENQGALNISFTDAELKDFRNALDKIPLVGVRTPETALVDQ